MSLRMSAVMMSMPLHSCVTMHVWNTHTHTHALASDLRPMTWGASAGRAAHLVLLAGTLAVLCERLQALGDEVHVGLVDVETQQAQAPRGAATHDVQELQRLTHQVVVGLVVLAAQEGLGGGGGHELLHMVVITRYL